MSKNGQMTPEQVRDIVRKAKAWDEAEARRLAGGDAGSDQGSGVATGGGRRGALADRISREVRREYFPGGTEGQRVEGVLGDLTPSQRAFAAAVAMGMDRSVDLRGRYGAIPAAASVRASLQASGVRFQSDTAGSGAEFTNVCPTDDIWAGAMSDAEIIDRLGGTRPIRGKSQKIVNLTGTPTAYVTPAASDCTELDCRTDSQVGTRTHEHTAAKISVDLCMPVELDEDAFLDLVEQYTIEAERAIRIATENAVIRGDSTLSPATANINYDGGTLSATATGQVDAFTAFDGIAHATIMDNTANNLTAAGGFVAGDPINADAINAARRLMRDSATKTHWGKNPADLIVIADSIAYFGLLQLEDVKWMDRVGDMATIVTGKLPFIYGMPIYMSDALDPTGSNGKIDGVTPGNNIYGQIHLVNKNGVRVGSHRDLETIVEVNRKCDLITITLQWRLSLARRSSAATAAGIEAIASIYGIAA